MTNDKFCIYGAGGHGKTIIDILELSNEEIAIVIDDCDQINELFGYGVLRSSEIRDFINYKWIVGIGDNSIRKNIVDTHSLNYGFAIHPKAIVSKYSSVDIGSVALPGAYVKAATTVGKHVIINTNVSVGHDCVVDDFVHLSPGSTLCGHVHIGEGTHIGAGAVVIPEVSIGKWVTVGAGAVILKDVPDYATVVGNPGKIIKIDAPVKEDLFLISKNR